MFNSKFNGLLTGLLIAAIIGIIVLIAYFGWSIYNKYYLNSQAEEGVDAFEQYVSDNKEKEEPNTDNELIGDTVIGEVEETPTQQNTPTQTTNTNTKPQYKGHNMVGTIRIPKIKIEYPILEKATPQAIKVAVAYLSGVGINKVGNTVIQGHNYRNGLFFSDLDKLSNGDKIYIKDLSGTEITYEVYQVFQAEASDSSFYKRDTNGLREITLSTCTDDGKLRVIVLAKEV